MKLGIVIICFIGFFLGSLGIAQDPPESDDVTLEGVLSALQERNQILQEREHIKESLEARLNGWDEPAYEFEAIDWGPGCEAFPEPGS